MQLSVEHVPGRLLAMKPTKLWDIISVGNTRNVAFSDLQRLAEAFGFELARIKGSHHIYKHPAVKEVLSLQPKDGKAKPYQVHELIAYVERYSLALKD